MPSEKQRLHPFKKCLGLIDSAHDIDIAIPQFGTAQVEGNHVGAKLRLIRRVETPRFGESVVQRCFGDGAEHSDHGMGDMRISKKLVLSLENPSIIIIEAHDHATSDLDTRLLNSPYALEHAPCIGPDILML